MHNMHSPLCWCGRRGPEPATVLAWACTVDRTGTWTASPAALAPKPAHHLESWHPGWKSLFWYIPVYTGIYRYIPVYTKKQDLILGMRKYVRFYIHGCGSQCDVDFQCLSMHAYTPMKDTSFTAVKSEKKHSVGYVSVNEAHNLSQQGKLPCWVTW